MENPPFPLGEQLDDLLQCGAPKIAKLVYNDNNKGLRYLWPGLDGVINQLMYHVWGPHIVRETVRHAIWLVVEPTPLKHNY